MSDQQTTHWLGRPITRADAIIGVAAYAILSGIKAALGLGAALLVAGAIIATSMVVIWTEGK